MDRPVHAPVLVDRVIEHLITRRGGIYLDGTLGGGGHAEHILAELTSDALYIGIDQDRDAIGHARKRLGHNKNIIFEQINFAGIPLLLAERGIDMVDGMLLDLGVSSYQIDTPERGFSYMQDGPLDMRMDRRAGDTAARIVNQTSEAELARIFFTYGEERFAKRIARQIVIARNKEPINTTEQLRKTIAHVIPGHFVIKSYARIFQALRIAVNDELGVLKKLLEDSLGFIRPQGRIVVIAYHSLEDRIVKQFFRSQAAPCICPPELPQCVCGLEPKVRILTPKALKAAPEELRINVRARSAVLRAAEVL